MATRFFYADMTEKRTERWHRHVMTAHFSVEAPWRSAVPLRRKTVLRAGHLEFSTLTYLTFRNILEC